MNFTPWHTVIPSTSSERQFLGRGAQHPELSASPAWLLGGLHRPILLKRSEVLFERPICLLRVVHELPYGRRIERQGPKDDGSRLVSRRDLGRDLPVIDPAPAVRAQVLEMHLERGDEGVLGLGLADEGALGFG